MTEEPNEITNIREVPADFANETREIARKVLDNQINDIVVAAYNDYKRPIAETAIGPLFEEIPEEDLDAISEEGMLAFLGDREPNEVDENEAMDYVSKYLFVALSIRYPWLMDRRKRPPGG